MKRDLKVIIRFRNAVFITLGTLAFTALLFIVFMPFRRSIKSRGEVEFGRYEIVRAPFTGRVTEVSVEPGAAVKARQALLTIHSDALEDELFRRQTELAQVENDLAEWSRAANSAGSTDFAIRLVTQQQQAQQATLEVSRLREAVLQAQIAGRAATETLRRDRALHQQGLMSDADLRSSEDRAQSLSADVRQSQIQLRDAEVAAATAQRVYGQVRQTTSRSGTDIRGRVDRLLEQRRLLVGDIDRLKKKKTAATVRASINGVVVGSALHDLVGREVTEGQAIASVGDTSQMRFVAHVSSSDVPRIRTGQPAYVEVDGLPRQRYELISGNVAAVLQPAVRDDGAPRGEYEVIVSMAQPSVTMDGKPFPLLNGMPGTTEIVWGNSGLVQYFWDLLSGT